MTEIQPLEQKTTNFNGDLITVVIDENGIVLIPLRPICASLGVDWSAQRRRINRDDILSEAIVVVDVTVTDMSSNTRPERSSMLALPLDYLNGWLFGINVKRVKPEIKERLLTYQRDCYRVLADAFGRNAVAARRSDIETSDAPSAITYRNAMAVANLAREQFMMRQQIERNTTEIADIRAMLTNRNTISDAQAAHISQAVKALALELGKRSGSNEFGGVYGELYRRYEITSYKLLPIEKFDEAMKFLSDWYASLTGEQLPF